MFPAQQAPLLMILLSSMFVFVAPGEPTNRRNHLFPLLVHLRSVRANERSRLPFDAPNRFLFRGEFHTKYRFTLAPVLDVRTGFPFSVIDEYRNFAIMLVSGKLVSPGYALTSLAACHILPRPDKMSALKSDD